MQVVWFKRDLRLTDHLALTEAAARGPVLPLYILEPDLWQQPDMSARQFQFLCESLHDLRHACDTIGLTLIIRIGPADNIFDQRHQCHPISGIWAHQETWNHWTYRRDQRIRRWAKEHQIPITECRQNGVIRRLANRDGWASQWQKHMYQTPLSIPAVTAVSPSPLTTETLPTAQIMGLTDDHCQASHRGGRTAAEHTLHTFLNERGEDYAKKMSSPLTAYAHCSRLSPYLAFGCLSVREVFHAYLNRRAAIQQLPPSARGRWPSGLRAFSSRLRWHCHFIQKLEDEPRIEFEHLHPAYDMLREPFFKPAYLEAWQHGTTGYPMVDACMRALRHTGWLNFRMRAMLMSFASHHLWLDWRRTAHFLARQFIDYEPGIHYSQCQMQSGTTGINAIRIYNPIKQGLDHDPEGKFIRQWIPELMNMPDHCIHTPWVMPNLMGNYPPPIVDEKTARQAAAAALYPLRRSTSHQAHAKAIVKKHASRKKPRPTPKDDRQGELPL